MESHRVAAKKKKKEDAGEDEDNIDSESSSSSDDEKEKDPSKFVETIPTGYAFPLLLSSLERDVTAYGLANTNAYDNERKLARSVIPTAVNAPFRGSVVAALASDQHDLGSKPYSNDRQ